MKKKPLAAIVVVSLVIGFLAVRMLRENYEWPANLGTLDEVSKRYPVVEQNAAATKLVQLALAAGVDLRPWRKSPTGNAAPARAAIADYVRKELERPGDAIEAPPPDVAQSLATHDASMNAVRDYLLTAPAIVWKTNIHSDQMPIPNLSGHMHLQRMLIARAYEKARRNDPAAWNELHASWQLNRPLWKRPEVISGMIALSAARMINTAARKMPLPVPAWFSDTLSFDYLGAIAASHQAEAWLNTRRDPILHLWFFRGAGSGYVRRCTTETIRSHACDVDSPQFAKARANFRADLPMPSLLASWQHSLRFEAEREATERILQMRTGQRPSTKSKCVDGAWLVTANSLKFSRDVKDSQEAIKYPLEYTR